MPAGIPGDTAEEEKVGPETKGADEGGSGATAPRGRAELSPAAELRGP